MIVCGDARRIPLLDESVQCVVTSPPYWGLRKYSGNQELVWDGCPPCEHDFSLEAITAEGYSGSKRWQHLGGRVDEAKHWTNWHGQRGFCQKCGAWRGAYGLEPRVEMYVEHTILILREIRRVLRSDGVCFWNVGDSYFNCTYIRHKGSDAFGNALGYSAEQGGGVKSGKRRSMARTDDGLKMKDLCLIPQRVALAAQADGWWVRSDIIWAKPNPMPESVRDRPTDAYEHILMLTKSASYYWEAEAVREPGVPGSESRYRYPFKGPNDAIHEQMPNGHYSIFTPGMKEYSPTRNLRNVWTFPTQPYAEAHFATYPEELVRCCLLAATSAWGACRFCGAPWERVERVEWVGRPLAWDGPTKNAVQYLDSANQLGPNVERHSHTVGWSPTCLCPGQHGRTVPCLVLDPFGGSGTTLRVAGELGRRCVSLDLAYHELALERARGVQTTFHF